MNDVVKEFSKFVDGLGDLAFDKALPKMQEEAWRIALKHKITGPDVIMQYMDWRSKQQV